MLTVVFQYTHVSVYNMLHLNSIMTYAFRKGINEIQVQVMIFGNKWGKLENRSLYCYNTSLNMNRRHAGICNKQTITVFDLFDLRTQRYMTFE